MYSTPMHNNHNMMRRSNNTLKTVGIVVIAVLFLYGLYAYHDLHSRHKRSEEKSDRLRQQHDSLSAQLQVVYEQKSRLDKLLQQEKSDHKQSKDDLNTDKRRQEQKFLGEKQELLNRIKSITSEHKMLQGQHEDLQSTFTKLQDQLLRLEEDYKKATEQHSQEFLQMKQEKDNEIAQLKDDIANSHRHANDLQSKLQAAIQQNQISQHQVEAEQLNIAQLQEQLSQLQGSNNRNLIANAGQNHILNFKEFDMNPVQKKQQGLVQHNLIQNHYNNRFKGNLVANLPQDQQVQNFNQQGVQQQQQQVQQMQQQPQQQQQQVQQQPQQQRVGDNELQQQQDAFGLQGNQFQDHAAQQQQGFAQQQEGFAQQQQGFAQQHVNQIPQVLNQQGVVQDGGLQNVQQPGIVEKQPQHVDEGPVMQVAQPGDNNKPYFDTKDAKPDHEVAAPADLDVEPHDADGGMGGVINQQQVLAPNINQLGPDQHREDAQQKEQHLREADDQILNIGEHAGLNNWKNVQEEEDHNNNKLLGHAGFDGLNPINPARQTAPPFNKSPAPSLDHKVAEIQSLPGAPVQAHIGAIIQGPAHAPVQAHMGAIIQGPAQAPVQAHMGAIIQGPAQAPVQAHMGAIIQGPAQAPVQDRGGAAIQGPDRAFVQAPDGAPIQDRGGAAIQGPDGAPIQDHVGAAIQGPDGAPIQDHVGAAIQGPNLERVGNLIQDPAPNIVVKQQQDVRDDRGPGQIVGPEVKDIHADRVEAPIGLGIGQDEGQLDNAMNLVPPGINNDQQGIDMNQIDIPAGRLARQHDIYHNNEGLGAAADNNDGDDGDDDNGDQLGNYPN